MPSIVDGGVVFAVVAARPHFAVVADGVVFAVVAARCPPFTLTVSIQHCTVPHTFLF